MKHSTLKTIVVIALIFQTTIVMAQKKTNKALNNKQIVRGQFDKWVDGSGNFFDLLADNVEWTIAGESPSSGLYKSKQSFLKEAVAPITAKLSTRITPRLIGIYQEKEVITLLWKGSATTKDNKPYRNTYCWVLTMKGGKISKVIAFLDTHSLNELMTR